jgi:hypothetical protein
MQVKLALAKHTTNGLKRVQLKIDGSLKDRGVIFIRHFKL